MPEWLDPLMNTSLASGLIAFACWGAAKIVRFLAPLVTEVFKSLKEFFADHSSLVSHLKEQSTRQTAFQERQVQMQDADGKTLEQIQSMTKEIHTHVVTKANP